MGELGVPPTIPSKPDLERLRTVRVLEVPKLWEVGGVGPVRELSQMFAAVSLSGMGVGISFKSLPN